ncbi:unnamed protein product [Adineta steineri]|uniref:Uncharacterized protein n=1 Tax=Adineta steineri TaxID=433720 RepID=A0A815R069_9BILA|nr:unnamed protein product [Adineta steineri]CAF1635693.1 unnamed protein product [Adineta steineri]
MTNLCALSARFTNEMVSEYRSARIRNNIDDEVILCKDEDIQWLVNELPSTCAITALNKHDVLPWETQNTNDNYYLNAFFGFSVEKPEGWYALSNQEISLALSGNIGLQIINNTTLGITYEKAVINKIIPLFYFMENPLNIQNNTFNANIMGLAFNLTGQQITGDVCDFLESYNKEMQEKGVTKMMGSSVCQQIDINGVEFKTEELTLNVGNLLILKQTEIVKITNNGYIFLFTLSYTNDKSKNILNRTMSTLKFS